MAKRKDAAAAEPEANWSGRKFRRKPEIVEAKQHSNGLWEIIAAELGVETLFYYDDEEFRRRFEPLTDGEPLAEN